jgi:hypothetical protein
MLLLSCLRSIPSATISCTWRIRIRSVISGMLRLSSLVRIGLSSRRHKIVPFHRPSMTDSIESIGQGETSFLDTDMRFHDRLNTDEFVSTHSWVTARFRRVN